MEQNKLDLFCSSFYYYLAVRAVLIPLYQFKMYSRIMSGIPLGIEGMLISVESDISNGLPGFDLVGFLAASVKEARDRVRAALKNIGYLLPAKKITVNLSPADIRKDGTGFDLAIAIAVLSSLEFIPYHESFEKTLFLGELGLDGSVLPVPGVLPIVHHALEMGIVRIYVPYENVREAAFIEGAEIIGVRSLAEIVGWIRDGEVGSTFKKEDLDKEDSALPEDIVDFKDIRGQESAKRGLVIAAAGFHNVLMTGEAGAGKSMMAKALPGILPEMVYDEKLEMTKIYSVAGLLNTNGRLMEKRPCRAPHYSITENALIGGGGSPKPGEISLASGGVLFMDEFPHFKRSVIEALRQPLEDKKVTISRLRASYTFPAKFMLVAARNNCPCGFLPDRTKCRRTWHEIASYQNRISHPIMDRIDIRMEIKHLSYNEMFSETEGTSTGEMRELVSIAQARQAVRYRNEKWNFNSELGQKSINKYIKLDNSCQMLLREFYDTAGISARGYFKILRLARTIADISDRDEIREEDVREALFYRNEIKEDMA